MLPPPDHYVALETKVSQARWQQLNSMSVMRSCSWASSSRRFGSRHLERWRSRPGPDPSGHCWAATAPAFCAAEGPQTRACLSVARRFWGDAAVGVGWSTTADFRFSSHQWARHSLERNYSSYCPPDPMSQVKILKCCPPRDAPSKLVQLWYKSFPQDQRGLVEIKSPTKLSNKSSKAWSCAEDQILEN